MGRKRTTNKTFPPHMKLASGTYYFDHGLRDGKRVYEKLGRDYPLALKRWAEITGDQATGTTTLADAIRRYRKDVLPTKAPKTQAEYGRHLELLRLALGKMPLEQITALVARQLFDRLSKKSADGKKGGPHGATRILAVLSTVFNFARQWGYTNAVNPRQGMRLPKAGRDVYLTDDAYSAIYAKGDDVLRDAMDLAYATGQRPSDVLRMSRTDLRNGELWVTPAKTKRSSGAKIRIPIAGELAVVLERIQSRPRLITSVRLFQRPDGSAITLQALQKKWKAARKAAGIPPAAAQFRDIRAKTATDLGTLDEAQALLAHTTRATTEGYKRGRLGDKVQALNRKIGKGA